MGKLIIQNFFSDILSDAEIIVMLFPNVSCNKFLKNIPLWIMPTKFILWVFKYVRML